MDMLGSFNNLFEDVFDNTFDDGILGKDWLQWDFPLEIYKELEGGDCDPINSELLGPLFLSGPLNSMDYETPDQKPHSHDKLAQVQESDLFFQTKSHLSDESCISENYSSPNLRTIKRRRSKRARKSNVNPWLRPIPWSLPKMKSNYAIRKERMKNWSNLVSVPVTYYQEPQNGSYQKCTHCDVTKTPLWREGPLGRKTLCNACGVRYKSGRLFPEYRPAASPAFVPFVHSNSHKKVIQLRKKRENFYETSHTSSDVFDF